jgi:branched-chain amino acid transport system substrate-binding protein
MVASAILVAVGTVPAVAADDEILVGAATSFSGWMAAFDVSPTHAAEIAIQDINAAGGVLGKKLKLVHIDTKTDQAQTARAAQDLVKQGVKMMLTACDFDQGSPAALVAQSANIIAMSSCGADIKYGNLTIGNNVNDGYRCGGPRPHPSRLGQPQDGLEDRLRARRHVY